MKWYANDYNKIYMWCGRRNCLWKLDFVGKMNEEKDEEKNDFIPNTNLDFKVVLLTLNSVENFEVLINRSRRENIWWKKVKDCIKDKIAISSTV